MSEHEAIPRVPRMPTQPSSSPAPQTFTMAEFLDLLRGIYQSQQRTNILLERIANRLDGEVGVTIQNGDAIDVRVSNHQQI